MSPANLAASGGTGLVGPHPSFIQVANAYIFEQQIRDALAAVRAAEAKEVSLRLQGIAWIDSVRKALKLYALPGEDPFNFDDIRPVRTFNTAAVYYHKFRLVHHDSEYGYVDAAGAALFAACKIEDTLKRSKEILCASFNLKLPTAEHVNQDDPMFDNPSKAIVGLERLMLEASGFDYRGRCPQKVLVKLVKAYDFDAATIGQTAYQMCIDLYRTFAPLKQTAATLAFACIELSARLHEPESFSQLQPAALEQWSVQRDEVMETLLDLLDLYTHHRGNTTVGTEYPLETFIAIRILLNQESTAHLYPRYTHSPSIDAPTNGTRTNGHKRPSASPLSPQDPIAANGKPLSESSTTNASTRSSRGAMRDGTVRFMLDRQRAREEAAVLEEFFKDVEEEYEVEVEQPRRL